MSVVVYAALNGNEELQREAAITPNEKPCLPSVSSALVLGTLLGLGEAFILTFFAGPILTAMGVNAVKAYSSSGTISKF